MEPQLATHFQPGLRDPDLPSLHQLNPESSQFSPPFPERTLLPTALASRAQASVSKDVAVGQAVMAWRPMGG